MRRGERGVERESEREKIVNWDGEEAGGGRAEAWPARERSQDQEAAAARGTEGRGSEIACQV